MKYLLGREYIYSSFSAIALLCLLTLCLAPADLRAQTTVTVQGIVELEGETDYGGVDVYFDPQSPSAAEKTVTTNSDGTWTANSVNVGIYTVRFSKNGFVPSRIPDIFIEQDSVLTTQFMKIGGLKNISGDISGTLYSDTLYVVTDNIEVAAGNSLVIEAGTEVRFDPETGLTVNGGTLNINGTAANSVIFSSNADIPDFGDWMGITINGGSNHILSHVTIDRALNAISTSDITNSLFDFIQIQNTSLRQLPFSLNGSDNVVSNSVVDTKESENIRVSGLNNRLVGNTFKNGFERSIMFSNSQAEGSFESNFLVKDNTIQNYTGTAIYSNGSYTNIEANALSTIHRNEIAIQISGNSAQVVNNDISVSGGSRTVNDRLKMIRINNGDIINNRISIEYAGTEDSDYPGPILTSNGGIIRDNQVFVNTDRRLLYFGILRVSNVQFENNNFRILTRRNLYGRTSAMGVGLSDYIYNSEVRNNTFLFDSPNSSDHRMGFYFRDSVVEDNEFSFLNSSNESGVIVAQNSTLRRNTISKTLRYGSANLLYKYAIRANGSSIIQNNVIYNERGIYAEGLDRNGGISYNEIHNTIGNEKMGIHITGASEADVLNNTLIHSDSTATGTGILVENNSSIDVQNNHIQNYATGMTINAVNNIPSFNNLYQNTTAFSGSDIPSQIGTFSTTNHQGSASDIYFNINVDPQFVSPADSNYALQRSSPLIDAGSDKLTDADGTRSDIGANPFDYGNPKNFSVAQTGEESITLSFNPVLRDSVSGYRILGGTDPASLSEMSLITDPAANSLELTGLTNNENYYLIAKTLFNNTESIPTDTITAIPGTASFTISSDSLIYVLNDADTSKTIHYQITNTGTKDFSVGGEISSQPNFANVGNSFGNRFNYSNAYNHYLPDTLASEDVLYMQVSGEIYYGNYRWDAQNFTGTVSDSSNYQPELLINGRVVTALESGMTEDHTYTFILNKSDLWRDGNQLQFQFNRNYYSNMNGWFYFKFAPMGSASFDETTLTVNDTDTVSTTLSFGSAPQFIENSISANLVNASDSSLTRSTYLVKNSTFGLSPTYFDEVATGVEPIYLTFSSVMLDNEHLQTGDELAIYAGNELVGSFSHNGLFPKIVKLDASNAGSPLTFQIYDNSSGQLVSAATGEEVSASASSLTQIELSATLFALQTIRVYPSKFNLMSLNVFPSDGSPASVFGGVSGLEIVQDDEGSVFIPSYNVNTIGQMNGERGYYMFSSGTDTLDVQIEGRRKLPSETDIELTGNRFNIIPNLYSDSVSIEEAMGDLRDKIVIAQDDEGNVWMPSENVNTIGQMIPGKGYLTYIAGNDTTYSFPDSLFTGAAKMNLQSEPTSEPEFFVDVKSSGLPYTILIDEVSSSDDWKQIDEVALFAGPDSDIMVGSAKIESHDLPLALTAWKENTDYELSGFTSGDRIVMKGYLAVSDEIIEIDLTNLLNDSPPSYGEGIFSKVEVGLPLLTSNGLDSEKPKSFELKQNYPNPFNPTTNIGYSVPNASHVTLEIYNVIGQRVATLVNEQHTAGHFNVMWDASSVSSGVYLVRMKADSFIKTNKMMLIK